MYRKRALLLAALWVCTTFMLPSAHAALNTNIHVTLEEPLSSFPATGISSIRGWAVGPAGVAKVELYIDGALKKSIPYGGPRNDVCGSYASYPGCNTSGFAMSYNFNNLSAGSHTFKVRATAANGDYNEASQAVTVQSFHTPYISDTGALNLGAADIQFQGNDLKLNNVYVDGTAYDLTMRWNRDTQTPDLYAITTAAPATPLQIAGTWSVYTEMDATDCGEGFDVWKQSMTIGQTGTTIVFGGDTTSPGTLNGSTLTLAENFNTGTETLQIHWTLHFSSDAAFMEGRGTWDWASPNVTCSGVSTLVGTKG